MNRTPAQQIYDICSANKCRANISVEKILNPRGYNPPFFCKYSTCLNKAVVKGYCRKHWGGHALGKLGAASRRAGMRAKRKEGK